MKYIIDFADTATPTEIEQYLSDNACVEVATYANFVNSLVVECAQEPPITEIVEKFIADDPLVLKLLTEPTPTKNFVIDDESNWWKLAVLSGLDLEQTAATINRGAYGVSVYVMDSGIAADHPEFVGKDVTLLHSVIDGDFTDTTGHGTALASLIVGETCGITEAALKVVKIFHQGRGTTPSELLAAFDAVASDYLTQENYLAVLNLSWSIAKNTYVEEKIAHLIDLGVFVVASAGNSGQPITDVTPAGMPDVITVGSFGQNLAPSDFSNYTASESDTSFTPEATNYGALDMFAPGEHIRIAKPDGGFGIALGTSLSAAITSAILSLNIASSGLDWDSLGEQTAIQIIESRCVKDMLTLSGNYAASPNVVPVANISLGAEFVRGMRLLPMVSGDQKAIWLYDGVTYKSSSLTGFPEWATLNGPQLQVTAPVVEAITTFKGNMEVTTQTDQVETYEVIIVVQPVDDPEALRTYTQTSVDFTFALTTCMYSCGTGYCCQCCENKSSGYCNDCSTLHCNMNYC